LNWGGLNEGVQENRMTKKNEEQKPRRKERGEMTQKYKGKLSNGI